MKTGIQLERDGVSTCAGYVKWGWEKQVEKTEWWTPGLMGSMNQPSWFFSSSLVFVFGDLQSPEIHITKNVCLMRNFGFEASRDVETANSLSVTTSLNSRAQSGSNRWAFSQGWCLLPRISVSMPFSETDLLFPLFDIQRRCQASPHNEASQVTKSPLDNTLGTRVGVYNSFVPA